MTAISRCFNNSHIVQRIIISVKPNLVENSRLRLVNRTFNQEYLHLIRVKHREVNLDLDDPETVHRDDDPDYESYKFYLLVNEFRVKIESGEQYFRFLVNVAGVKVKELRATYLFFIEDSQLSSMIHNYIMRVFLANTTLKVLSGISYICDGCVDCERHAIGCREYGPLQYKLLIGVFQQERKHFDKLIVWESLFFKIATSCVQNCSSRDECLTRMRSFITPNISCDHLEIVLNEKPLYQLEEGSDDDPTQPIPREVLEEMCKVWRVKSIGIELNQIIKERVWSGEWSYKEFFTEFRFDDRYEMTRISTGMRFNKVEINLDESYVVAKEMLHAHEHSGYENLIANAMRMFPTEHLSVRCTYFRHFDFSEELFERILKAFWKDDGLRNTHFTLQYSPRLTTNWLSDIPKEFQFQGKMFTCEFDENHGFENPELLVRMFKITERLSRCRLDLEIHLRKNELDTFIEEQQGQGVTVEELNAGFLKYFL